MQGQRLREGWRAITGQCGHNIPDRMLFSVAHRRRARQVAGMTVEQALDLPDYRAADLNYDVRTGWVAVDDRGTRAPRRREGQHRRVSVGQMPRPLSQPTPVATARMPRRSARLRRTGTN